MQDLIDKAIEAVKALPESAQVRIGQSMLDAAERHRQLNAGFARRKLSLTAVWAYRLRPLSRS